MLEENNARFLGEVEMIQSYDLLGEYSVVIQEQKK